MPTTNKYFIIFLIIYLLLTLLFLQRRRAVYIIRITIISICIKFNASPNLVILSLGISVWSLIIGINDRTSIAIVITNEYFLSIFLFTLIPINKSIETIDTIIDVHKISIFSALLSKINFNTYYCIKKNNNKPFNGYNSIIKFIVYTKKSLAFLY